MLFYIAISSVLCFTSFLELFGKISKTKCLLIFYTLSFVLWIISFIRWDVGTDWSSYYQIYEDCDYIDWYEWGFISLNRLVKHTVDNYSVLLAILGGILFYFQTKAIKHLSILPLTTLFILWGTNLGSVFFVRQSVAVAILMYSIVQIKHQNLKNFILLVIGATLIHAASIVFLPAYWIYNYKFSFKFFCLALAISFVLGSVGGTFIWGGMGNLLGGIYAAKLEGYMETGAEETFNTGMSAADLFIRNIVGKLCLIALFVILISKQYIEKVSGILNLFFFAAVMLPITISVSPTLGRMWTPYIQLQIFLMTFVMASANRVSNKLLLLGILLAMTFVRLYLKLFVDYDGEAYLPFQTIFSRL